MKKLTLLLFLISSGQLFALADENTCLSESDEAIHFFDPSGSASMPTIGGPSQICSTDNSLQTYTILSGELNDNTEWTWYVSGFMVGTGTSIQLQTNFPISVRGEGGIAAPGPYETFTPNIVPGPSAVINLTSPTTCGLSNGVLSAANSTNVATYSWTDGFGQSVGNGAAELTGLAPASTYFLTVTSANGCTDNTLASTNNSSATPTAFIENTGNPYLLEVTNQAYTIYQWQLNGIDIGGAVSSSYVPTQNGDYTVSVSLNNCVASSNTITVSTLSIQALTELNIVVFPNPVKEFLSISNCKNSSIIILDIAGKVMISKENYNGENIHISSMEKGVYHVIISKNNKMTSLKFVKN